MTPIDFNYVFTWYLIIFVVGISCLPLTLHLFDKFWDKGYAFTKTISLIIITFAIFFLSFIKLVDFSQTAIVWLLLAIFIVNILFKNKYYTSAKFLKTLKQKWPTFLAYELVFFGLLLFWSYVRAFRPDIDNLEKPMDWGFINSALRSNSLPPQDMWYSGQKINYYYFGHLVYALLTKLSAIPSSVTYNLAIATVLALTFISIYSLSANLIFLKSAKINKFKLFLLPLFSALLLSFGGNLHAVYKITKINITNNQKLVLSLSEYKKASLSYWYPDATRFIGYDPDTDDKTIHEFPLYSFVVADLHGHMNNIPQVLLLLAFLLSFFVGKSSPGLLEPYLFLPTSFLLSIVFMTNAWDFANFGLFFAMATFLKNYYQHKSLVYILVKTTVNGLLTILFWYLFTLPFLANFQPMMEGLRWSDAHSPFWQLAILYGGFWLICWPFVFLLNHHIKKIKKPHPSHLFVFSLIATASILVLIPEIFYIKDIYVYTHRRANTMFKLVYAAFMMYALSSSYVLAQFSTVKSKFVKYSYKLVFGLVISAHLIYPYFAIRSNYASLKTYQGLDGLNFVKNRFPDNYQAIVWINRNITGQPVMLEAAGDSYTDYNLISSSTGLPTVEGWIVHEWLWRGGYDAPAARQTDVASIYQSPDISQLRSLVQKYSIDYIFIGDKEVEKYENLNEDNISSISDLVFQSNQTKIYKIKK